VYANKFDPVKRVVQSLISYKKTPVQHVESVEQAASDSSTSAVHSRKWRV